MRLFGGQLFQPDPAVGGLGGAGDIEGVAAGDGLTGGGTSGSVTLNVGAGAGITVNANDVAIDTAVVPRFAAAGTFTAAQTLSLEDAGTNTTLRPAIIRRTTSGTAAAGLGVGLAFELEDDGGSTDSAGSLDLVWADDTAGSEDVAFVLRTEQAGSVAEVLRVGAGTTVATALGSVIDLDAALSVGRCVLHSSSTDRAIFGHRDHVGTGTSYAIAQLAAGSTQVNCVSGQSLLLRSGDTTRVTINNTGIGFFATAAVAAQTSGANLTNNVTSGGTDNTVDDVVAAAGEATASDLTTTRNAIYQLARKLKQVNDGLRAFGLFT